MARTIWQAVEKCFLLNTGTFEAAPGGPTLENRIGTPRSGGTFLTSSTPRRRRVSMSFNDLLKL